MGCGIGPPEAGGYSSHAERPTCQETSEDLPSFFSYHFVRRPKVTNLVTIPWVDKEFLVTIPRVNKVTRSPFCPSVFQARHHLPQPLVTVNFDTMVVGMRGSCKHSCPPPAMQVNASNDEAGGNPSRTSGGSGSYFISFAQLVVNSWIVGFARLSKPLANLRGDKPV